MKCPYKKLGVFWGVISAVILASLTQGFTAVDPETAVGVWLFNEVKGDLAKDLSENAFAAKFVNDVKWTDGKFGGGLEFKSGGETGVASRSLTDGVMDEVALFNLVLTEDQITEIAQKGLARPLGVEAVSPNNKLATAWWRIKAR